MTLGPSFNMNFSRLCHDIIRECGKFARNEIRPAALELDLEPDPERLAAIWDKSRQLELPGLMVPASHDGGGMDSSCAALVLDCLAAECAGTAALFAHHFTACAAVATAPDNYQELLFSKLANTDKTGTMATVCLPTDLSRNRLTITGDILEGVSPPMGNAELAGGMLAFARTTDQQPRWLAVWIDKSTPGVSPGQPLRLPGLKAITFAPLACREVRSSDIITLASGPTAANMLSAARRAFYGFVAAAAMGCARAGLAQADKHARQRYQFGRIIIDHPEIRRMTGAMQMKLNAGTAAYLDLFNESDLRPPFHSPQAPLTKAFCTEAALEIILDAIQIHGGYGYMQEYGLEKRLRDIKVLGVMGEVNPYLQVSQVAGNRNFST